MLYEAAQNRSITVAGIIDRRIINEVAVPTYTSCESIKEDLEADAIVITSVNSFEEMQNEIRKHSLLPIFSIMQLINATKQRGAV